MVAVAVARFIITARYIDSDEVHAGTGSRVDIALAVLMVLLVLLCQRTRRIFRVKRRVQHGQRGSVRAIATSSLR
jgi:hypothetical protein